jgi:quercetin dioxygenase-like cupin family protein
MTEKTYTAEELEKTRVARFKDLKPFPRAFVDTVIPEYERDIFSVIGAGVLEDPAMRPKITEEHCFSVGIIRMEPGKGAGLHAHTTEEVFIPLKGKCTVFWGDDAENEIELDTWDTFSVPIGVMRGFRNDGDETAVVLAINGGHDSGRLTWHEKLKERAAKYGGVLDDKGYLEAGEA